MPVVKFSVSLTPELYSALTRASLRARTNVSREVETCLREHPMIQRCLAEVRKEPDLGVHAVSSAFVKELKARKSRPAMPPA